MIRRAIHVHIHADDAQQYNESAHPRGEGRHFVKGQKVKVHAPGIHGHEEEGEIEENKTLPGGYSQIATAKLGSLVHHHKNIRPLGTKEADEAGGAAEALASANGFK